MVAKRISAMIVTTVTLGLQDPTLYKTMKNFMTRRRNMTTIKDIEIIAPSVELMDPLDGEAILKKIERCGRTCYKSEERITEYTAFNFVKMLVDSGHHSVLEHVSVTVRIIGDRSMSHQLVRHRIAAYSQESQRYCDYGKFGKLQVVVPPDILESDIFNMWMHQVAQAYDCYKTLRDVAKIKPEDARSVLPNCTKTEVVTTYNLRQWRHVFVERALNPKAQWQIKAIMRQALDLLSDKIPVVFDDLREKLDETTGGNWNLSGLEKEKGGS